MGFFHFFYLLLLLKGEGGYGFFFMFCYFCLLGLQFKVFTNLHILLWPHGHVVRVGCKK
jgi:hypothetical protein